jgi:restriction endonuclease Mrr
MRLREKARAEVSTLQHPLWTKTSRLSVDRLLNHRKQIDAKDDTVKRHKKKALLRSKGKGKTRATDVYLKRQREFPQSIVTAQLLHRAHLGLHFRRQQDVARNTHMACQKDAHG